MFIKPAAYKVASKYSYPNQKVKPDDKTTIGWMFQYANAFWSEFVQNKLDNPYEFNEMCDYDEWRAYAEGRQSMEKLKDRFRTTNPKTGKKTTKMNVSWRGMDFMAKQFDVMRSMNQEVDFDIDLSCIDPESLEEREYAREYLKTLIQEDTRAWLQRVGFKPNTQGLDPDALGLRTSGQVDLYFDSGGFPLQKEIKLQAAIETSLNLSNFQVIKDMVFDDLIVLAKCGLKTEINNATAETTPRYVDPKYALVPYSKYLDYRNINRAGELRFMTIAEIKEEHPEIPDSTLLQIAKDYAYMNPEYEKWCQGNGNGYFNTTYRMEYVNEYGVDPMMACRVMVLDAQFISADYEKYVKTQRSDTGGDVFYQVDNTFDPERWTNRKLIKPKVKDTRCFRKYEFKWIVGTKQFLKCGLAPDVIYDGPEGNLKPKLDYRFYRTGNKSVIQRCIAHIDDMNLALIKKRNALKTLPPAPRMIINEALLSNVMLNGIIQQPEDLIRTLEEKGFLVVKTVDDFQRPVTNGKMVDFIPSGIIEDITIFSKEIEDQKNNIREVTGVNQIADASNPDPEQGLGKSRLAISATNHALFPTFRGFKSVFEGTCTDLGEKWQLLAKKKEKTITSRSLSSSATKVLVLGSDVSLAKYSLKVSLKTSDEDKRMLLAEITGLKQQRRANGGFGGITGAQYLFLYDRIMAGQTKLAMYMLAQIEQQQLQEDNAAKDKSQQIASDNAMAQSKQNSDNAIAEESAKQKEVRNTTIAGDAMDRKTKIIDNVLRMQATPGAQQIFSPEEIKDMLREADAILASVIPTDLQKQQAAQAQAQEQQQAQQQSQDQSQVPDPEADANQEQPANQQEPQEEPAIQ